MKRPDNLLVTASLCVMEIAGFHTYAAQPETRRITSEQVLDHLNLTISWYGHINSAGQTTGAAQDVLIQDSLRRSSAQVIKTAFAFARAQAILIGNQTTGGHTRSPGQATNLEQIAAAAAQRIERLQDQISDLNEQIRKAPKRKLQTLVAQRDTLTADLSFAKLSQSGLRDVLRFANSPEKGSGLAGQIDLLASSDSVPAALNDSAGPPPNNQNPTGATAFHPESAGIAPLLGNCFQLMRTRGQIDSLLSETAKLNERAAAILDPLRTQLRALISRGDAIASATANQTDPQQLDASRQQIELMSARFKALSSPILPLSEQGIALQTTQGELNQWRDDVDEHSKTVLGYLAFRLGTVGAAVGLLLIISEVVRRATFRYVRDTRRRRQFVLIRRFVVGTLAALIVVITSVSGIGSFATVAGFVTAGLAVALQNVILSIVAYFFLIGRYGLRAGDRVTVSGVTGQVIEVGLVRMYLMELAGTGTDVHSTGRVAVFSNSVIFQPAALIKQAPGTEYVWHTVSTVLTQDTDLEGARTRIGKAVESIYQSYKSVIESQHAAFERSANLQLAEPTPVSRARFTDAGVEVTVRYPVEIQQMSEVDEKVIDSVMRATGKDPQLKLAANGFPKVLPAV